MVSSVNSSAVGGTRVNTQNTIDSSINYDAVLDRFLGIFLDRMFSGGILNPLLGSSSNPLALTGGAIMLLPFLTSLMNGAHATQRAQERVLPPKPQPTLVDSLNDAESNLSEAKLRLDTTKLDARRQIDDAAQKLGLNVSDSQQGPKKPSKDSARLKSVLLETNKLLKKSPDDLRLQVKAQILKHSINAGLSYTETQARIYDVSKKFDDLESNLSKFSGSSSSPVSSGKLDKLKRFFSRSSSAVNPHKEALKQSLNNLEESLAEIGIYDLDQVLGSQLKSAKKFVS